MDAESFFYEIQMKFFEIFISQDPGNVHLDTIFEIGGKKLYANKSRLSSVSATLYSKLFDRRTSKNDDPIQIKDYKFEDFNEFLTFIYSGECKLNDESIFAMIDMAESYGVQVLKNDCEKYLSKMKITMKNVLKIMEASNKHSLVKMKKSVKNYFSNSFLDFIKNETFLNARKETVEVLVTFIADVVEPEELFRGVYEWVEHRVKKSNQENFDLNEAIKAEITPFLPGFEFKKMNMGFLNDYVVKRGFIFSDDELTEILNDAMSANVKVKVTNSNGQSIFGYLPKDSDAVKVIQSLKNRSSDKGFDIIWRTNCEIVPPPTLKKRDGVQWYLDCFSYECIRVLHETKIHCSQYFHAEMTLESPEFVFTQNCKIGIE